MIAAPFVNFLLKNLNILIDKEMHMNRIKRTMTINSIPKATTSISKEIDKIQNQLKKPIIDSNGWIKIKQR